MRRTILACAIVSGTYFTDASPVPRNEPQFQIQWGPCPNNTSPGLDCGQLAVPIDWNDPTGNKTTIGMTRFNASDSANKIGNLIFNPGGPGEVASTFCELQASGIPIFSDALAQHFDIICPDPRGVGTSTPIMCDVDVWNQRVSLFPQTQAEFEHLVAINKAKGESCLNLTGPLLKHIGTISTAKDFEAIRIALNDGPLNYLAMSYGTLIGITYAQLFPDNFRVIALDGVLDHTQDRDIWLYVESSNYENSLDQFFQWCAANATACGLYGNNIPQMYDDLVAAADKTPIPAPGCLATANDSSAGACRPNVTGEEIRLYTQGLLQFKTELFDNYILGWDYLGFALNQTIVSNNATLLSSPLATSQSDLMYSSIATGCLDFDWIDISNMTQAFVAFQEVQRAGNAFNPHIGSASNGHTIQATCVGWPVPPEYPQVPLNQTALSNIPTILMVNAVHDTATSYIWALSVNEQIENSVLLTRQGDGHTSYFSHGEAAMSIDSYLVNRTLPQVGTVVQS